MSVFSKTIKSSKLSDFEAARPGEHPVQIDPGLIDFLPQQRSLDNPGLSPAALLELGENMARIGQIQPVIIRPNPEAKGRYVMVAGERRCRAAALKGLTLIAYVRNISEEEHLRIQRAENIHREALTNSEIAQALRVDKERLGTLEAVAAEWQKSINWVSERLRYLEAVESQPVVQRAIEEGVTGDITTLNELNRLARQDPDSAASIVAQAIQEPNTNLRKNVRERLKNVKPGPVESKQPETVPTPVNIPSVVAQTVNSTRIDRPDAALLESVITSSKGEVSVLRERSMWKIASAIEIDFQTLDALVAAVWGIDSSIKIRLLPPT